MEAGLSILNLNEQQLDMLRLLRNPLPMEYFEQLRKLAVQLLGKQLDEAIDKWEAVNDISQTDYEKLSKGHFRTPYKKS